MASSKNLNPAFIMQGYKTVEEAMSRFLNIKDRKNKEDLFNIRLFQDMKTINHRIFCLGELDKFLIGHMNTIPRMEIVIPMNVHSQQLHKCMTAFIGCLNRLLIHRKESALKFLYHHSEGEDGIDCNENRIEFEEFNLTMIFKVFPNETKFTKHEQLAFASLAYLAKRSINTAVINIDAQYVEVMEINDYYMSKLTV